MSAASRFGSLVLAGLALTYPAFAADAPASPPVTMSVTLPAGALDATIADYLKRNPEAVAEALQALQAKIETKRSEEADIALGKSADLIYKDPASPVAGNPDGKETLVEFFDYSCHYCKQIHPDIQALIKADPNVKVIFKDIAILGPGSVLAEKAALAARLQGKYMPMHDALLEHQGQFDDAAIRQVAQAAGVDYDRLKADMDKPEVQKQMADNMELSEKLNIHGTPSLIINNKMVPGALPLDELKRRAADVKG